MVDTGQNQSFYFEKYVFYNKPQSKFLEVFVKT